VVFLRLRLRLSLRNTTKPYESKKSHHDWTRNGEQVSRLVNADRRWQVVGLDMIPMPCCH
jgi:hypothetical protein